MKTITIDDNPSILNLMRFIMNKIAPEGSHFFVSSAEEGFSLIEREGIRIVFLDGGGRLLTDREGRDQDSFSRYRDAEYLGHRDGEVP